MSANGTDDGRSVADAHSRSASRATAQTGSTSRSRVVTVPAWARNLPPDDFPDEDEWHIPTSQPARPQGGQRRRSIASLLRTPTFNSIPNTPTVDPSKRASSSSPAQPLIRRTSASEASSSGECAPVGPMSIDIPARPTAALNPADTRRSPTHAHSSTHGAGDRWWTFTLPTKHLHHQSDIEKGKVRERARDREASSDEDHSEEEDATNEKDREKERKKLRKESKKSEYHRKMSLQINQQLAPPGVFSMNQTQTPGWSAPWTPFHRTDSRANADPFAAAAVRAPKKKTKFEQFVLENVFAPLVFRAINLALNVCTLALASHIRLQEHRNDVIGVIGSSTLMAIVVAPLAITHIFVNLYIEYFGRPIGLWRIRTKMTHTFSELIFICLWSSVLSLAFDDLFTSSLECTAYTPYRRYNTPPTNIGSSGIEGTLADQICSQQIAIVTFVMLIVAVYILVLVVSLFRIFAKVSRKS